MSYLAPPSVAGRSSQCDELMDEMLEETAS
jgi:hypothetical protein